MGSATAEQVYGIPLEQVVGSSIVTKYEMTSRCRCECRRYSSSTITTARRSGSTCSSQTAPRRLREFGRRPRDAGMDRRRRWGATRDARPSRRSGARVRLRTRGRPARHVGRHFLSLDDGRAESARLDGDQHEERLEADLPLGVGLPAGGCRVTLAARDLSSRTTASGKE
jgi:hypothetical protein